MTQMEHASDEFHARQLERCCRACGTFIDRQSVSYLVHTPEVSGRLLAGLNINVEKDKENIHPRKMCNNCYVKCGNSIKNSRYQCSTKLVPWEKHDAPCSVCCFYLTKQRGGKKRKTTMGRGRPPKKLRVDAASPSTINTRCINDIVPPKFIDDMPSLDRFVDPNPELICSIFKDVLQQPLQGPCQHSFFFHLHRTILSNWSGDMPQLQELHAPTNDGTSPTHRP